jgi:hypothetical protein
MSMQKWTRPDYYMGASWPGYYVFLGQNRDSSSLDRSNFKVALAALGGETSIDDPGTEEGLDLVTVVRESHWACGWIEWIAIHESATDKIALANKMLERLDNYPVLDEEDWSELEYTEAYEYWDQCGLQERIDLCARAGESIFAARSNDHIPDAVFDRIRG